MINYIDEEEKEIIESLNSEEWVSDFNDEIKKQYEEYAKHSSMNTKKISAYISERDFNKIRLKAMQIGIPYESLIALIVRKYNEGKIGLTI
jgi:predicted DNA binding CopG/RHH family protein